MPTAAAARAAATAAADPELDPHAVTYEVSPSAALAAGDIAGLGGNQLPQSLSRAAQAAYLEFSGSIAHALGARRTPNYASTTDNFVGGYGLSYGDPRGRYVYATIEYTLH